jgi:asparagine synthase (glutamine-hydrolysing)
LLATTPELVFEHQPFTHPETGCTITADVRLDNRNELIAALDIDRDSVGDAELILNAYLNWGEACPNRLLGDFAFAVWDPRDKKMFCARDHSGMRQLYYHHKQGAQFMFGTDARAILVLPQVPYRINQGRIADFLVQELEWIDYTSTFFEDVFRLPPGHRAKVTHSGIEITEYWRPDPVATNEKRTDEEYKDGFLEVFTQAVDARLRAPTDTVGSMLSGGMDSGSVVAIAKERVAACGHGPLHTYSGTLRDDPSHREYDEIRSIAAATSMASISPTLIKPESLLDDFSPMISGYEEPFDGECTLLNAVFRAASADDRRVVLDGAGGDVVLGAGTYIIRLLRSGHVLGAGTYIIRLLRSGHWATASNEIAGVSRFWNSKSCAGEGYRYLRSAIAPEFIKQLRKQSPRKKAESLISDSLISRDFAEYVRLEDRVRRYRLSFPGVWVNDYAVERCDSIRPNMTAGRERYARLAAAASVEACDPFMDKRVIDYCSTLPGRLRLKDGWPKFILRDLMAGKLPDEVCWGRGRHHVGYVFNAFITESAAGRDMIIAKSLRSILEEYVSATKLANAWQKLMDGEGAQQVHNAYVLSTWLRENGTRPVVTD